MNRVTPILKPVWPYLLLTAGAFYLMPWLIPDGVLLYIIFLFPLIIFAAAFTCAAKNPFQTGYYLYPVLVAAMFLPTVYIFYNYTALIYTIIYAFIALGGCLAGRYLYSVRQL